jgi:hypothetical protein
VDTRGSIVAAPAPTRGGRGLWIILIGSLSLKLLLLWPAHATCPTWDAGDYFRVAHGI